MKPRLHFLVIVLGLVSSARLAVAANPSDLLEPDKHRRLLELRQKEAIAEYKRRAYPQQHIPAGAMTRALAQIQKVQAQTPVSPRGESPDLQIYRWLSLGPAPMTNFHSTGGQPLQVSGRVTSLAVDPLNNHHWLLGAAQGGIWQTFDSGGIWTAQTDDQPSLAIGAIAFAPSNPSLVYAGTGEGNFSADSYAGAGLLMSTNAGTDWQMINTNFAGTSFSRIQVAQNYQYNVYVATVTGIGGAADGESVPPNAPSTGVFMSGDGGTSFTQILTGQATDIGLSYYNFLEQYAGLGNIYGDPTNGLYRTTNGWTSWELINGPWTSNNSPTNIGRIAVFIPPLTTELAYVAVAYPQQDGGLAGIWETTNAWAPQSKLVWTQLPQPDVLGGLWYSFFLSADPSDFNSLYFGEETIWHYTNGFWDDLANLSQPQETSLTHADQHAMAWVTQGDGTYKALLGNDGGVWLGSDPSSIVWTDCNNTGLTISQIYKGSVHPNANQPLALIGTQDNGSAAANGTLAWNNILSGDGGDNAISASNPDTDWATSWETFDGDVDIERTEDAGVDMETAATGIDASTAQFFVHFAKSPNNDDLFIAGTTEMWICTNFFSDPEPIWTNNSPEILNASNLPTYITAMAFAPSDTNSLTYAFGTEDGQLWITTNGGLGWNNMNALHTVPGRDVSGLAFHPGNPNILYVSLSGFDENTPGSPGHLFDTTNALAANPSWNNVSPPVDLPIDCVAIDPNNGSSIFAGSDIGVWMSGNSGGSWTHFGPNNGMPNVAVFDIKFNSVSQVTAFTHGRGAFVYAPINAPIPDIDLPLLRHPYFGCLQCPPDLPWVNPGDLVSMEIPLQAITSVNTVNLTATMLASAQVQPLTASQDYGALNGQGGDVSQTFEFIVGGGGSGSCGETVPVVLQLEDQGVSLGDVTIPFVLGEPSHPLAEDFEETPPPALPRGWTSSAGGLEGPWIETTNTPPNVTPGNVPDDGGDDGGNDEMDDSAGDVFPTNTCAFAPAPPGVGQTFLYTPAFAVATPQAQLYFAQAFIVSNGYDGCRLQIAMGSRPFQDIVAAGGAFAQNGYNAAVGPNNPLGPGPAWSGDSGGWLPTLVNLPAAAAGQTVQLRWNFATSRGMPGGGWYVDTVEVTEPTCLPPVNNPEIVNAGLSSTNFTFAINTVADRTYVVEYKTNLLQPAWQFLENVPGNGSEQIISIPVVAGSQSYYRFHLQ